VCDDAVVRAGGVAALVLICACATTTSAVAPDEKLDPRFAYLYGRFHIKADEQPGSFGGRQSIGLKVRCGDLREYTIWFTAKPDVQVLKVYLRAARWSAPTSPTVRSFNGRKMSRQPTC